jgi:hypothetical protein
MYINKTEILNQIYTQSIQLVNQEKKIDETFFLLDRKENCDILMLFHDIFGLDVV